MKNLKIILTLMLASTVLFTYAQDLIKDTRNGVQHSTAKKSIELNSITKKVKETFENGGYMTSKAFGLEKNQKQIVAKNKAQIEDAVYLTLNESEVAKIVQASPKALKLQIPVTETNNIELELIKNNFFATGFKVTSEDGEEFDVSDDALFYKGYVNGDVNSIAGISIINGKISGVISDKNGNYDLGSIKSNEQELILYNSNNAQLDNEHSCGVNELDNYYSNVENKIAKTLEASKGNKKIACDSNDCVGIYFEVAQDLYDHFGSKREVIEYVTTVFNNAALIFEKEGIKICLSHIFIWTNENIYSGPRNVRSAQFIQQIKDYDYPGVIGFVLSYIPGDSGGYASVYPGLDPVTNTYNASIPLLCHDHVADYNGYGPNGSITFQTRFAEYPTYSRDVALIAHETGHTFGSPHTHACAWTVNGQTFQALDNCAGQTDTGYLPQGQSLIPYNCTFTGTNPTTQQATIMSYCGNIPLCNGFGTQPGNLMRANYQYGVDNGCFTVKNNDDVFASYPFLNQIVDQNACNGETISVFKSGAWRYIYVETNGSGKLYTQTGSLHCTDGIGLDCVNAYNLYEIEMLWTCCENEPVDPNPTPNCDDEEVFNNFPFLYHLLDRYNCTNERVRVYDVSTGYWIYVETNSSKNLYWNTESLVCSTTATYDCLSAYTINESDLIYDWTCCEGVNSLDLGTCEDAVSVYPWLNINNNTCTEIFDYKYNNWWNFIYVILGNTGQLFLSNGSFYGTDSGNGALVSQYGLNNLVNQWTCNCCQSVYDNLSNFETGFGIWNDGGAYCQRINNANNANSGNISVRLRFNKASSLMTTDPLPVADAEDLYVSFSFIGRAMEGTNEKFRLQISSDAGVAYCDVKQWTFVTNATPDDADQNNATNSFSYNFNVHEDVRYSAVAKISGHDLTNNTRLRFRSYFAKYDYVYIDDVNISTCPPVFDSALLRKGALKEEDLNFEFDKIISLYPNPAESVLNIDIEGIELSTINEEFDFEIYSFDGRLVKKGILNNAGNLRIDINQLAGNQSYLIKLQTSDGEVFTDKFVKN